MPENEDYEDWDEESEKWDPEWFLLPEDLIKRKPKPKKVKETEEVVVTTYGSTPWSNDKPPRPDRPKKKKKIVIAEYVQKYRWEGPMKGPRGGTYMISPGKKKVYDKSKWPRADRAAAERAAGRPRAAEREEWERMPIKGWNYFEKQYKTMSGVPTALAVYHRVTRNGTDLTLKIDMRVPPALAQEMTEMINRVFDNLPSMILKHNRTINILSDIYAPGMGASFGTFAQNVGKYGQRYSEIELNARLFKNVEAMEGRYAKWDEILAHEMTHGMVRGMASAQNPTYVPHIPSMREYIDAFVDDAESSLEDLWPTDEKEKPLRKHPEHLRREKAYISRYAYKSATTYQWEQSVLDHLDGLVEDIAETIGYMSTNVRRYGGVADFKTRYPNRVKWYEKWVLGGKKWQGPRQ